MKRQILFFWWFIYEKKSFLTIFSFKKQEFFYKNDFGKFWQVHRFFWSQIMLFFSVLFMNKNIFSPKKSFLTIFYWKKQENRFQLLALCTCMFLCLNHIYQYILLVLGDINISSYIYLDYIHMLNIFMTLLKNLICKDISHHSKKYNIGL